MSRLRMDNTDSELFRAVLKWDSPAYGPRELVFGPYTTPGPAQSMATRHAPNDSHEIEMQVVPADAWRTYKTISR